MKEFFLWWASAPSWFCQPLFAALMFAMAIVYFDVVMTAVELLLVLVVRVVKWWRSLKEVRK